MWEHDFESIINTFKDKISYVNRNTYTIIMEEPEGITKHPHADVILTFSPQGELVIYAERICKKDYKLFKWLKEIHYAQLESPPQGDLNYRVVKHKSFVDIIEYKRWWYEWAKELL